MRRLNSAGVMEKLAISSKTTLRKLVEARALPLPLRDPGSTTNFWLESDIDEYLRSQVKTRAAVCDSARPGRIKGVRAAVCDEAAFDPKKAG